MQAISAAILSIYVLFGSIGTPLYIHSCFVSEEVNYSFDLEDACCSGLQQNAQTTVTTPDCCVFTSTYLQVDYDAFSLANNFSIQAPAEFLSLFFQAPADRTSTIQIYPEWGPPIFYGRTLRAFIQSFLI